jgi:hypothetical protein
LDEKEKNLQPLEEERKKVINILLTTQAGGS